LDDLRRIQICELTAAVRPANCPADATGLAVACSGGPDSMVLLHALAQAGYACPLRVLHVCHHLYAEAEQWAAHCSASARQLGVAFKRLDVTVAASGAGMEAAARHARYKALAGVLRPGEVLVLAHHADDQAETFLLQALRGSGVAGLAAMPQQAAFAAGCMWRPLLELPRVCLQTYARQHALNWVEDPSNRDPHFDRGYLRTSVRPALQQRWPAVVRTLARSAHWCAQAAELITEIAAEDIGHIATGDQRLAVAPLQRLSPARQAGVLRHWLTAVQRDAPDHRHLRQLQQLLHAREQNGPVVAWRDTEVRLFDGHLHAMAALAPPPGVWQSDWWLAKPLQLPAGCGALQATVAGTPSIAVNVRFRRGGERYFDPHYGHHRSLKKFLQAGRVPPWRRSRLPLLHVHDQLVAIADHWQHPQLAAMLGLQSLRLTWLPPASGTQTD